MSFFEPFWEHRSSLFTLQSAAMDGLGNLYAPSNNNNIEYFSTSGGGWRNNHAALSSTLADIVIIGNGASAAYNYTGSSAGVEIMQLSTGYRQRYSGYFALTTLRNQMIAADDRYVFSVGRVADGQGKVAKIDYSSWTSSAGTISGNAANVTCVIRKTDATHRFLYGWNNSKITEVDETLTIIKTVTIPTTNISNGAPSITITNMAYYNGYLFASTDVGVGYVIDWVNSTVIQKFVIPNARNGNPQRGGLCLSNVTSTGQFMSACMVAKANLMNYLSYWSFKSDGKLALEDTRALSAITQVVTHLQIDETNGLGMVLENNVLLVGSMSIMGNSSVQTRIQNPPGTDVGGRVIRIRDHGVGKSTVDLDTTISAGATSLPARPGTSYYEIVLVGSGSSTQYDWRRFNL